MRALLPALASLAALCGSPGAAEEQPFPQGLYGDIRYGRESGDLGGFEVRFYRDAATGRHMAEFTLCEGWCNEAHTAEVTRDGDGFTFSHIETLTTFDGERPVASEDHLVVYRVTRAGKALRVQQTYDGQDMTGDQPWRIRPIRKPYGLEVARREQAQRKP